MNIDGKTLHFILRDAWFQFVSTCIRNRTMAGLAGMDGYLTMYLVHKLPSLQRALLSALHSGAFMTAMEHAKYDPEKTAFCTLCGCEDDRAHWVQCPRYEQLRQRSIGWPADLSTLPPCTLHHLLVPQAHVSSELATDSVASGGLDQIFLFK